MYSLKGEKIEPRLFTIDQACDYVGRGRTMFKAWAKEIGAERRFGKTVRYDRLTIDRAIDAMGSGDQTDR